MPKGIYKRKKLYLEENKIKNLYINEKKSTREIGRILKVSGNTINKKLRELNIKIRDCKIDLDLNKIGNLYVNQKKSIKEISKSFGVGENTIRERLIEMNIKRRKNSQKLDLDTKRIADLYVNKMKTIKEIAKILKVSVHPIHNRLIGMNIKIRKELDLDEDRIKDLYINKKKPISEIARDLGVSAIPINRRLDENKIKRGNKKFNLLDLKKIVDLYVNQKKSATEIGKIFEVSNDVIIKKLKERGIKIRKHSPTEFKKGDLRITGKNSYNWAGGKSFEPYGKTFNNELRKQIRKRDNHTCQECGKHQRELKRKLSIHHIDYIKSHNSSFNLISLCGKCHLKTNRDRKHWTNYFKMKIFFKEFFDPRNIKVFNENRKLIAMGKLI